IEIGVMPPPWPPPTASPTVAGSASAAVASAAGAAASVAGATASAAGAEAGAAGAAASCARTGELAIRTAAPAIARRIFVFLLSSMFRQFLLWSDSWNPRHGPRQSAEPLQLKSSFRRNFSPAGRYRNLPKRPETPADWSDGTISPRPQPASKNAVSPFGERLS